jgi:uncharacterized protein (DUF302 family)
MDLALVLESDKEFTALEADFTAALKERGYGIMTRVDVRQTMDEKGVEFDRDIILLGICNPGHAKKALTADEDVALMLPCSAVVYGRERGSTLKIAKPSMIASFFDAPGLAEVAAVVEADVTAAGQAGI